MQILISSQGDILCFIYQWNILKSVVVEYQANILIWLPGGLGQFNEGVNDYILDHVISKYEMPILRVDI